jgi:CMP-N-acetylneuraminic acid synthetase
MATPGTWKGDGDARRNSYVVAAVFARGGSKGIPRKNLRVVGGRSLLAHAIDAARATRGVDRVIVSTDDDEIAQEASRCGAEVPFRRPDELATDEAPEWLAWRHAIRALEAQDGRRPDVLLAVPATAPLREPADVEDCLRMLLESDADVVITVTPASRNPYFNMVRLEAGNLARLVIESRQGASRRQDAPEVFDMATVAYAARTAFVLEADGLFSGRVRAVVVPRERALDVDTELDLRLAEFLVSRVHG